jgi:hypothetical protein
MKIFLQFILITFSAFYLAHFITVCNRLREVKKFLKKTLDKVKLKCEEDIIFGRDCEWRLVAAEKLVDKHFEMCSKFWRPLESFIKDDSFLK